MRRSSGRERRSHSYAELFGVPSGCHGHKLGEEENTMKTQDHEVDCFGKNGRCQAGAITSATVTPPKSERGLLARAAERNVNQPNRNAGPRFMTKLPPPGSSSLRRQAMFGRSAAWWTRRRSCHGQTRKSLAADPQRSAVERGCSFLVVQCDKRR